MNSFDLARREAEESTLRILRLVAIAVIVAGVLPVPALAMQAGCPVGSCLFNELSGYNETDGRNSIAINVDGSVKNNPDAIAAARLAVERWNNCLQVAAGNTPRLVLQEGDTSGLVDLRLGYPQRAEDAGPGWDAVFVPPDMPEFPRWTVYIREGMEGDPNLFDHEMGHFLNLASHQGTCGNSVMSLDHPGDDGPLDCDCQAADDKNETRAEQEEEEEEGGRPHSPLVFDIDGDRHIPTVSVDSELAVFFDLTADGVEERVGWLADTSGDAFLWLDLNDNGTVDDGGELFGTATQLPSGNMADNGYVALATYDQSEFGGNSDGAITAADEIWPSLRLWFDLNRNGASEAGETSSLDEHDITVVSLRYARNRRVDDQGNIHTLRGRYWGPSQRGRGVRQRLIEDIWFLVWNQ